MEDIMMSLEKIAKRLAQTQDDILLENDFVSEAKSRLTFEPSVFVRKRRIAPVVSAATCAALAAAAAVLLMMPTAVTITAEGVALEAGDWVAAQDGKPVTLAFSDGSRVRLGSRSGLRIQNLYPEGAHLLIERGDVFLSVNHRQDTRWMLDVGPYLIAVTGTMFDVSWNPDDQALSVEMISGSVRIEGPMIASGTDLSTGERLRASISEKRVEISAEDESEAIAALVPDPDPAEAIVGGLPTPSDVVPDFSEESLVPSAPAAKERLQRSPTWQLMAKQGRFDEAVSLAESRGLARILTNAPANELMALGDAARHVGKLQMATDVYTTVRKRFPETTHSSAAAFDLGKMAFDQKRDLAQAARWFKACLDDRQAGMLEREATGRLMEALDRTGDASGARAAARRYLDRFPGGPHAPLARKLAAASR